MAEPPAGPAAFLAAEIVIDSAAATDDPGERAQLVHRAASYVRQLVRASGGQLLPRPGGGSWAIYDQPIAAVAAAATLTTTLHAESVAGELAGVHIGIGLHVGTAEDVDGEVQGPALTHLGHLLRAATRTGWIVMSRALWLLVGEQLPSSLHLRGRSTMTPRDGSDPSVVYVLERSRDSTSAAHSPSSQPAPHAIARKRPINKAPSRQRAGTPPEAFRIYMLGRFQVERGGVGLELSSSRGQKALQLFKCLLSRPPSRRMPFDQAFDTFWPGSERGTFRSNILRLRDVLEPDVDSQASILQYTQEIVYLRPEHQVWVDADEFERLIIEARHSETPDALLEEADRLWAGDFLPDDLFHDWSGPRRAELRRLWTELQFELARRREQRSDEHGAEAALQQLLAFDPTDEQAARELMILQTRHGRRSDAFKVYQRLEEALAHLDEHMEPAPETQAIRQRIAAGEIERGQSATTEPNWLPFPLPVPPPTSPTVHPRAGQPPAETTPATASDQPGRQSQLVQATNPASPDAPRAPADANHPSSRPDNPTTWPPLPAPPSEAESFTPTYPFPTPGALIGRQADLVSARQVLERGLTGGQMLLIGAAAGTGKSALAGLILAEARKMGFLCLAGGSFDQDSPSPYAPIRDALCDYLLAQPPEQLRAELGHLVTDLVPIVPELRYHLGEGSGLPPGTPEPTRLLAAVHGCLRVLAMRRPTLLCLEDLHAVDGSTLDMLQYLARQTLRLRLVIVGTFRPEEVQPGRPLARLLSAASRDGSAQVLRLAQLTRDETQALIAKRLSGTVSETLTDTLFAVTEGNPLFIEQLVLALREERHIVQRDGVWYQVDGDTASIAALPPIVESVIERRFDRLPPGGRGALAMAAVLGQAFELQTLLAALAPDDADGAVAVLDNAREAQLLRDTPTGYRFGHAMIREALYRRLSRPRRALLHARAGAVIEESAGERAEERAAELAHHFALAASVAPTAEKALRFCLLAGRRAAALSAHREALRHYSRAFDLLSARGAQDGLSREAKQAQQIEVLQGRGTAEHDLGVWQAAIDTFQEVLSLTDDPYRRARAYSAIGRGLEQISGMDGALAAYDDALAALEPIADQQEAASLQLALLYDKAFPYLLQGRFASALQAGQHILHVGLQAGEPSLRFRGHCMVALSQMWSGQVAVAIDHYTQALQAVQLGSNKLQIATAHENFGTQLYMAGRFAEARSHITQAAAFYRDAAGERRTVLACQRLSRILLAEGDLSGAFEHGERGRILALEVGDRHAAECNAALGAVFSARAAWSDAIASFERALEVQERVGHLVGTTDTLLGLGLVHERLGAWDVAERHYLRAASITERMDIGVRTVAAARHLGRLHLRMGRREAATAEIERAVSLAEGMPGSLELAPTLLARAELRRPVDRTAALADAERARTCPMAADVATEAGGLLVALYLDVGNLDAAAEVLTASRPIAERLGTPFWLGVAQLTAGRLAAAQGTHEAAYQALDAALGHFEQAHVPYERAWTLLALAGTLESDGRDAAQVAALRTEAADIFSALGKEPD